MIIDSGIVTGSLVAVGPLAVTGSVISSVGFTGSLSGSATTAISSSYATNALTASYASNVPLTASYALTALTASYAANVPVTASYANNADLLDGLHASVFAQTGSNQFNGNQTVTGSLTVTGQINAQTLVVQTITSSVLEITGSNQFGSTTANTHEFTGSVLITGSLTVNGSSAITSAQTSSMSVATASYVLNAVSSSRANLATTASYVLNAVSASYALTASYISGSGAGVGFPFSGSAIITGSLFVSSSFISGSFKGDGSQLTGLTGGGKIFTQTTPTASWVFTHNLNQQYPNVTVYDSNNNVVIPQNITATDTNTLTLTFGSAVSGYAIAGLGGSLSVTGRTIQNYFTSSTTWSFQHNLGDKFVSVQAFDDAFEMVIPTTIRLVDATSSLLLFDSASSGYAIATIGGDMPAISSSYAGYNLQIATSAPYSASWVQTVNSASYAATASLLNPIASSHVILTRVSASLNFADDTAAAAGGVPLGGLYRNGNFILIRIV